MFIFVLKLIKILRLNECFLPYQERNFILFSIYEKSTVSMSEKQKKTKKNQWPYKPTVILDFTVCQFCSFVSITFLQRVYIDFNKYYLDLGTCRSVLKGDPQNCGICAPDISTKVLLPALHFRYSYSGSTWFNDHGWMCEYLMNQIFVCILHETVLVR